MVTEYLGDGVLALFRVDAENKINAIYQSYFAAADTLNDTRAIVNNTIARRYSLPPLDLGVGLAYSKTIVTLVGLKGEKHPKAFGECVFRASKLSKGRNQILVDEYMYGTWPTGKEGKIRFQRKILDGVDGYAVT